jgi:hypothetical protein
MITRFTRSDVADACRKLGPTLKSLPPGMNGVNLLWAITGNESSFGANCNPKHEPAYDVGGRYSTSPDQAALLAKFGSAAACSYGPMQVMLCNAPSGSSPADFDNLETGMSHAIYALQKLINRFLPVRVAEVGYCWNGGHIMDPNPDVKVYGTRLAMRYLIPLPTGPSLENAGKG